MYKSNEDKYLFQKQIYVYLFAAEKLVLDDISTGASNDLEVANKYCKRYDYCLWYE